MRRPLLRAALRLRLGAENHDAEATFSIQQVMAHDCLAEAVLDEMARQQKTMAIPWMELLAIVVKIIAALGPLFADAVESGAEITFSPDGTSWSSVRVVSEADANREKLGLEGGE